MPTLQDVTISSDLGRWIKTSQKGYCAGRKWRAGSGGQQKLLMGLKPLCKIAWQNSVPRYLLENKNITSLEELTSAPGGTFKTVKKRNNSNKRQWVSNTWEQKEKRRGQVTPHPACLCELEPWRLQTSCTEGKRLLVLVKSQVAANTAEGSEWHDPQN